MNTTVGRYEVRDMLGRFAGAALCRAWDVTAEREVALALWQVGPAFEQDRLRAFIDRARAYASVTHAGLMTIVDAGVAAENLFIAMRPVSGPGLAGLQRPG
ncbi:MAG: serine/threonine protein kinase, partial [Dehalococcoidia bacterium]